MEAVNLLPAYARPGHPWAAVGKDLSARRVLKAGSVVACVAVLGLGLGYAYERSVVNDRRATLADVQAEVAVAEAKAAPFRSAQAAAAARMAAAGTVSSRRVAWERLLARPLECAAEAGLLAEPVRAVADAAGSWCGDSCSDDAAPGTPAPATTGASGFSATGVASSHVRVALVLDRLASLPWLSNVTLVSTVNGGTADTVPRRHVHRHRRLQPDRRCEMIDRINGRLALLLAITGLLILVLAGWFVFVSPQSSKAAALDTQIGDANVQLATTQSFMRSPAARQSVADLRRLRRAIPDDVEMSEILRQLAWASRVSGVRINSITPSQPVPSTGAQAVPIALTVKGRYFRLAKFMHLLRLEAGVKDGKAHASGRLYGIDNILLSSGDKGGLITATLALNAFVNGSAHHAGACLDDDGALDGLGGSNQTPRIGEQRADRREAAPPEDPRRRARCRARRAARVRAPAPAQALQRQQLGGGGRRPGRIDSRNPRGKRLPGGGNGADPFAVKLAAER